MNFIMLLIARVSILSLLAALNSIYALKTTKILTKIKKREIILHKTCKYQNFLVPLQRISGEKPENR